MNETIQSVILLCALVMIGYGLWLVEPAAMYVGVGGLLLTGVVVTRAIGLRRKGTSR